VMNKLDVDHGLTVPLNIMCGKVDEWPMAIIPIPVNVVMFPVPTGDRCWRMGEVIRKAVEAFPEDLNVVIFGTGGMSHQIHGERSGMINTAFDTAFLNDLTKNPKRLRHIKHAEYVTQSGAEGIEMVMWMVMRAALGNNNVHEVYRHYHVPASNTAAGLIILENDDKKGPAKKPSARKAKPAKASKKASKKAAEKPAKKTNVKAAKKSAKKSAKRPASKQAAKKNVKKAGKKAVKKAIKKKSKK
jgi:protocatechuate 4,5-dioxygenase, beta chain